jgi:hypothetical protein
MELPALRQSWAAPFDKKSTPKEKIMSAISLASLANLPPLSTSSPTPKTNLKTYFKERTSEVQQLNQALKSGDLATAQQDYNKIVALGNHLIQRDNPFFRPNRALDFNAIGGALQNGDLAGARQAYDALQNTYGAKKVPQLAPAVSSSTSSATLAGLESGVNVIA